MTAADALRRLLADVRAARLPIQCKKDTACKQPACDCCETCWLHEKRPCPPDREFTMRVLGKSTLDYLERLALDGMAGEANGEHAPTCDRVVYGQNTLKPCDCGHEKGRSWLTDGGHP